MKMILTKNGKTEAVIEHIDGMSAAELKRVTKYQWEEHGRDYRIVPDHWDDHMEVKP